MAIKQLNGTYVGAEDRILLRVNTDAGEEIRLWLTRSITVQLLAAVHTAASRTIAQKFSPQVAQTVAEFEQQSMRAQTKLDDQFLAGATFPLGDVPVLVVKLAAAEKSNDVSLELTLSKGNKVSLSLPRHLAQQFAVLLDRIQENASWGLAQTGARVSSAVAVDTAAAATGDKKIVH